MSTFDFYYNYQLLHINNSVIITATNVLEVLLSNGTKLIAEFPNIN
jgi:hypothetical protein